jgi:hypothetical protein
VTASEEEFFVLSNLSPGSVQKWLALAVVLGLLGREQELFPQTR